MTAAGTVASVFGLRLPADSDLRRARIAALEAALEGEPEPTGQVAYRSRGRVAVIGPEPAARAAVEALPPGLSCHVFAVEGEASREVPVAGWLGAFRVGADGGEEPFDLVLDLRREPAISSELPPPGYFAPGRDQAAFLRALEELPAMVGEFRKAAYVRYDPHLCAHGARGVAGCRRCLDACPAEAIRSVGERVVVETHLCHGAGICASACPTGAMGYAAPDAGWTLAALRRAIGAFREAAAAPRVLLFGAGESAALAGMELPDDLLPWQIAEAGAAGLEVWLGCLAYGAREVILLAGGELPASTRAELERQLAVAGALLAGLGWPAERVRMARAGDAGALRPVVEEGGAGAAPATFAAFPDKRALLRLALDHLAAAAPRPAAEQDLPPGAPFGAVEVAAEGCTLCLSCVAVCPTGALGDGVDTPRLDFSEESCVQCGLCRVACPEGVVSLHPRYLYQPEARRRRRVLREDAPWHCSGCGKPFGTLAMMEKMRRSLAAHPMFQGERARMLGLCEDCRVRYLLELEEAGKTLFPQ